MRDGHVLVGSAALGRGPLPTDHRVYGWADRRPLGIGNPADAAVPESRLDASSVLMRRNVALAAEGFPRERRDLVTWTSGSGCSCPPPFAWWRDLRRSSGDAVGL